MIIYKIKNLVNNKVYVGQSTTSGDSRWMSHRNNLRKGIHPNLHLQSSWNKYEEKSFTYSKITEACLGTLDMLEMYFIKNYNSTDKDFGYNKDHGGHLSRNKKSVSEETRKKLSESHKGKKHPHSEETKQKISKALKGRPSGKKGIPNGKKGIPTNLVISKETRLKLSKSHKGKKRPPVSDEARKNISDSAKIGWLKRKHCIGVVDV